MTPPIVVDHFFRHEYGKMVSIISHKVGIQNLEVVEDAVQSSLIKALESWTRGGLPNNPSAWLFKVAFNEVMAMLRQGANRSRIVEQYASEIMNTTEEKENLIEEDVQDDLLRMLFVCSNPLIPEKSQLVLALKTLCGFGIQEIGSRLFISDANVYKRLGRARNILKKSGPSSEKLSLEQYRPRLPGVLMVLYIMFTEGFLSSRADLTIRKELCEEAIRLASILIEYPFCQTPESYALIALMHLHSARITSRQDGSCGLLLLEEQNRMNWDKNRIRIGLNYLAKSAKGDVFSRYHAEAGIAAEHCLTKTYKETRWDKIVDSYTLLEKFAPSPLHRLNRAVAVAEWQGAEAGLLALKDFDAPRWLTESYLWFAVLAYLHQRCGNREEYEINQTKAMTLAPTPAVKALLKHRLSSAI